jgi:6-phosphogluconate dehydrogenase
MGMNMGRRLLSDGHEVVAYNRSREKTDELSAEGAVPAYTLQEVVNNLPTPRVLWLMLPAGDIVEDHIDELIPLLDKGDILIDGGNGNFRDDIERNEFLEMEGLRYLDVGTSGGIWGLTEGYCLMIGGKKNDFDYLEPVFKSLAPANGYIYCGEQGAGHYVKMIHNGIEYAMMQAYAEGFSIIKSSPYGDIDFAQLSKTWNNGSVIRSWLLELAGNAFNDDPNLESLEPYVEDSGEGRWTVMEAIEQSEPAPIITLSLMERFRSRQENSFGNRILAALRNQFGGHAVKKKNQS